ncbi:flagellar hook-associated protein FlgK [Neorhizobium lilium]|uniref:Flagellar hook-associated protein 1 n=1 Tax=Neorhizobium lilium TaxID=2503024 RepID=A0A444LFT1_9HYPH|nr:flagellar hook-associated protein FlgK [Neorhizobium lilium]RWX77024.1 flagellar hook-associated protein FlgK [Neorhizobium lilium]
MSLASALSTTKNTLSNSATQTAVLSTNVQNVSNSDYNRRTATVTTNAYSGATTVAIDRTQDSALLKQTLTSTSDDAGQQTLLSGLNSLHAIMGGDDYALAPSKALADMRDALQAYAATPGDSTLASAAVNSAVDVATSLNTATTEVQNLRADADQQIGTSIDKLNKLLSQFKDANDAVMAATSAGADANDALDTRESLLKQISGIVGVSTATGSGNNMSIYTSDGITLFETSPRTVSYDPRTSYSAANSSGTPIKGSAIYIDGVELGAGKNSDSTAQGSLQAFLQLRDEIYPTYQDQLDEIARGLVSMFSEKSGADSVPGLFGPASGSVADYDPEPNYNPSPDTPQVIHGLAGLITVNQAAINDPSKLRDGSIAGDTQNPDGASGFSTLLNQYVAGFETARDFDPAAQIGNSASILDYSTDSVGWAEEYRSGATNASETTSAMLSRSTEAYSNSTGVNLDEELILLLDVEQSYKAASKLLSTIDDMLGALMEAAN